MEKSLTKSRAPSSPGPKQPLPSAFFQRDTIEVARQLLGKGLFAVVQGHATLCEIVEVEAYRGSDDPASHAFRGQTKRNWPMFEVGGTCYVYLSYGLNFCMNVVTGKKGQGEAVLLRAAQPLVGIEVFRKNRPKAKLDKDLLSGPGKLTQALGVDLSYNGRTFREADFKLIDLGKRVPERDVIAGPRIGISKAVSAPWRFCLRANLWISKKT